jgi:WD40 repeat protein
VNRDADEVKIWDLASGKPLCILKGHEAQFNRMVFSPDSQLLATTLNLGHSNHIWNVTTGRSLATLTHKNDSMAFSPDSKRFAWVDGKSSVKVSEIGSGKEVTLFFDSAPVWCLAFSPDGERLATALDANIKLWDARNGHELLSLSGDDHNARHLLFSADGRQLVSVTSVALKIGFSDSK